MLAASQTNIDHGDVHWQQREQSPDRHQRSGHSLSLGGNAILEGGSANDRISAGSGNDVSKAAKGG
jgi:Ca2+-binding RTX toxin-like protein